MGNAVNTFVGNVVSTSFERETDAEDAWVLRSPSSFRQNPNKIFFMIAMDEAAARDTQDVFVHAVSVRTLMKPLRRFAANDDAVYESCQVCNASFGVFRGRHRCRFCAKVCCKKCVGRQIDGTKACEACYGVYVTPQRHARVERDALDEGTRRGPSRMPRVNSRCFVDYRGQGMFKPARIVSVSSGRRCVVAYDDGDCESNVPFQRIRADDPNRVKDDEVRETSRLVASSATDLRVGQRVYAVPSDGRNFQSGEITAVLEDGRANVRFDDGTFVFRVRPSDIRRPPSNAIHRTLLSPTMDTTTTATIPMATVVDVGPTATTASNENTTNATASVVGVFDVNGDVHASSSSRYAVGDVVDVNLQGMCCVGAHVRVQSAARPGVLERVVIDEDRGNGVYVVSSSSSTSSSTVRVVNVDDLFPVHDDGPTWRRAEIVQVLNDLVTVHLQGTPSSTIVGPFRTGQDQDAGITRVRAAIKTTVSSRSDVTRNDSSPVECESKTSERVASKSGDDEQSHVEQSTSSHVVFEGFLSKRSRDGGAFRSRYFQLRYGVLFWYSERNENLWKGALYLYRYRVSQTSSQRRRNEFVVEPVETAKTASSGRTRSTTTTSPSRVKRSLHLSAKNAEEMAIWIRHIRRTIDKCDADEPFASSSLSSSSRRRASTTILAPTPPRRLRVARQQSRMHLYRLNRRCWCGWLPSPLLPKLDDVASRVDVRPGMRVKILWWRYDEYYSSGWGFASRRSAQSLRLRVADKNDPPPKDAIKRWFRGVVRPLDGNARGGGGTSTQFRVDYDDGDRSVHDFSRVYYTPIGESAKAMRNAKVLFNVSWVDSHGKRFPPDPQELVATIDRSACSRLIICSVTADGKVDTMRDVRELYLDPQGLLSASWAAGPTLNTTDLSGRATKSTELWAHGVLLALLKMQTKRVMENKARKDDDVYHRPVLSTKELAVTFGGLLSTFRVLNASEARPPAPLSRTLTHDERFRFYAFIGQAVQSFHVRFGATPSSALAERDVSYYQTVPSVVWEIFSNEGNCHDESSSGGSVRVAEQWRADKRASQYVRRGLRFLMNVSFRAKNYRFVRATPALIFWRVVENVPEAPLPLNIAETVLSDRAFMNEKNMILGRLASLADDDEDGAGVTSSKMPSRSPDWFSLPEFDYIRLQVEALVLNTPNLSSLQSLVDSFDRLDENVLRSIFAGNFLQRRVRRHPWQVFAGEQGGRASREIAFLAKFVRLLSRKRIVNDVRSMTDLARAIFDSNEFVFASGTSDNVLTIFHYLLPSLVSLHDDDH